MPIYEYGRARAINPGKHGPLDWRVEFNKDSPRHAELIWMLGYFLLAEDRYTRDKRDRLWHWAVQAYETKDHDGLRRLADRVQLSVDDPDSQPPVKRNGNSRTGVDALCTNCREQWGIIDGLCGRCSLKAWKASPDSVFP